MKIAIVGAGPAGSTAAFLLAQQGRHEVYLLDKDLFPRPKTCGSGLGPRCLQVLRDIGLFGHFEPRAQKISGLRFVGPTGQEAILASKTEAAWIVPRETFDGELAKVAEQAGATFHQGFFAKRLLKDPWGKIVGVSDGNQTIETDLVMLADGAHSRFSIDKRPRQKIAAIMAWYEGLSFQPGILEMYYDPRVRPWYGWLFPETDTRVNVGICYNPDKADDPKQLLDQVIGTHVGKRLVQAQRVGKVKGHPIVYSESVGPVTTPGAIWLGEAARLTNAATGEGIFYAMRSACVAAQVVGAHGQANTAFFRDYQAAVHKQFAWPLRTATGLLRFVRTPAFDAASALLLNEPVRTSLRFLLQHA